MDGLVAKYPADGISEAEVEDTEQVKEKEIEKQAAKRAFTRAKAAWWDLNIAICLFLFLIVVTMLLFQAVGIEIVAPFAIFGLACFWLVGWHRQRKLYGRYFEEELINLVWESSVKSKKKAMVQKMIEETVEDYIQRALFERRDKVNIY
ncbi:hypothetical protein ACFLV4_07215 [Chloroflexota bacterium]